MFPYWLSMSMSMSYTKIKILNNCSIFSFTNIGWPPQQGQEPRTPVGRNGQSLDTYR